MHITWRRRPPSLSASSVGAGVSTMPKCSGPGKPSGIKAVSVTVRAIAVEAAYRKTWVHCMISGVVITGAKEPYLPMVQDNYWILWTLDFGSRSE